ncbi:MAG: hypothetical protein ABI488_04520 [Polyangiaceae bacterium]
MTERALPSSLARLSASAAAGTLLWVSRTLLALLVAYPLLAAVEATAIAGSPDHDAVLFRPGSLMLLELVRVGLPWSGAVCKLTLVLGALSALFELLPLACALDLLHDPDRTLGERATRAIACFPRFFGLGAVTCAAQAALLLAASLLAAALKSALEHAGERALTLVPFALFGLALLGCLWLGSVLDLARAAVMRDDTRASDALRDALTVLRDRPLDVLSGAYVSALGGLLAYLVAAWWMTRIDLSGPVPARLALVFAAHQLAIAFAIAWRVRWLRRALNLSARSG